jgi:hypothetical protein
MFVLQVVQVEQKEFKSFKLSAEGEGVAENGSHEAIVFAHVPKDEGITQKELMVGLFIYLFIYLLALQS